MMDVPTYYILHLFSGHSREGDLDWWAQKLTAEGEFRVVTIPFDLVHHKDKGDLTNDATFKLLLDLLRGGKILAIQAGPPCETWSCARHQPVDDGRHAPRPLRSSQYLWGVPELTLREQLQVEVGNQWLGPWFSWSVCWWSTRHSPVIPAMLRLGDSRRRVGCYELLESFVFA